MMRIDCRFPGGNIKVHDIFGDTIFISPDLRGASVPWFYWAFRVTGAEGRTLVFRFISDYPIGTRGPAISTDGRKSWHWTNEPWDQGSFRISIPGNADEIFVAFAPTYTEENWKAFVGAFEPLSPGVFELLSSGAYLKSGYFAESKNGRDVEILFAGAVAEKAKYHVVVTARHYCSEMVANLVMEGMIFEIARGESDESRWLRENVSFSFIPFVDKDGVEDGDQGRGRNPHDFGQDYGEKQIYHETAAVRNLCKSIIRRFGKLDLFLDLECPWIRGGLNETVHFVGKPENPELRNCLGKFLESQISASSLPFSNTDSCDTERDIISEGTVSPAKWASSLPEVGLSAALEIPYANARDTEVTWDRARLLGAAVARALAHYNKCFAI